jgi:hypothetical protein
LEHKRYWELGRRRKHLRAQYDKLFEGRGCGKANFIVVFGWGKERAELSFVPVDHLPEPWETAT